MNNLFYIYLTFAAGIGAVGAAPMPREPSIAVNADTSDAAVSLGRHDASSMMLADEQNPVVAWGRRDAASAMHADEQNNVVAWGRRDSISAVLADENNNVVAWGKRGVIEADDGNNIIAWGSKRSRDIHTNAARDYVTPGVRPVDEDEDSSIVARKDPDDIDYTTPGVPRAIDADSGNNIIAWGGKPRPEVHTHEAHDYVTPGLTRAIDADAGNNVIAWGIGHGGNSAA